LKDQPGQLKMANYIIEGTDTLNRLVTTILNYARPVKLKNETVNLNKMLTSLKEHIEADSGIDKRIKITIKDPKRDLEVSIDPDLLKSAILNLIVNAIQAMPEGGTVQLEAGTKEESAFISVKDTGCGIAPENIPKLYSPFFTTRTNGNGFGLAEVLKIVQAHGGKIEVTSEIGKGTCFTINIPINTKGLR
jgi:signal transduction histidine kinase